MCSVQNTQRGQEQCGRRFQGRVIEWSDRKDERGLTEQEGLNRVGMEDQQRRLNIRRNNKH